MIMLWHFKTSAKAVHAWFYEIARKSVCVFVCVCVCVCLYLLPRLLKTIHGEMKQE